MSSIVTASGVSFDLPDGRTLFSDLQFSLDHGLTGLVGPNGIGKTCLTRLVVGDLAPTSGAIVRRGPIKWLPQREAPPQASVAEVLADYAWSDLGGRLLSGIDWDASCTSLSGGQWMRVRLARAIDDGFLVLDEPTNDLDSEAREAVITALRERRGGALVVSHDRACLEECDAILELSRRGITRFGGGWSDYVEARDRERERLSASLVSAKREREVARREEVEARTRQEKRDRRGAAKAARGGIPKILLGGRKANAEATRGRLDAASRGRIDDAIRAAHQAYEERKDDPVMYAELGGAALPAQKVVAEAEGFNVLRERWLYAEDLSFTWRGSLRIALRGANGAGKSTLLEALVGMPHRARGMLRRGELRTLYLDQRLAFLDDSKTVLESVREASSLDDDRIRAGLATFLFPNDAVFRRIGALSGGERLRVALARGFLTTESPELLVLDEPTNNLDLANVAFLESFVRAFRGALVVVSHDEVFLENCGVSEELVVVGAR